LHPVGIVSVVTPDRASTESEATFTVGRSAFKESGAPTMNGNHAAPATGDHQRTPVTRSASPNVSGRKMMPHGWVAMAMPIANPAAWSTGACAKQRCHGTGQCDGIVEVSLPAQFDPSESSEAAADENQNLERHQTTRQTCSTFAHSNVRESEGRTGCGCQHEIHCGVCG
jgi:hypothetical protein